MAAAGVMSWEVASTYGLLSAFSYDGTYIWMIHRHPSNNSLLYRFDPVLKKFIKPDGSVGDYTNAGTDLGASSISHVSPPVSNGTHYMISGLAAAHPNNTKLFRCSDFASVQSYYLPANVGITGSQVRSAFYYNNEWFYPGWSGGDGMGVLVAFDASGGSRKAYLSTSATGSYLGIAKIFGTRIFVGLEPAGRYVEMVDATTMTRTWVSDLGVGKQVLDITYDSIRDEVWISLGDGECMRLRGSDGAMLKRDATTGTYSECLIATSTDDSLINQGTTVLVNVDHVWAGGGGTTGFRVSRRSTSPTAVTGQLSTWSAKNDGNWIWLPNHPCPQIIVNGTIYFAIGGPVNAYSWTACAVGWVEDTTPAAAANLTDVNPGTGPHISLIFDSPVGITGPTIGAASSGLGVTGVTAISSTQIDLACAIRPDAPEGGATSATLVPPVGEADNLGPPVPTGVGATVT